MKAKYFNIFAMLLLLSQMACVTPKEVGGDPHLTNNVVDWRDEIIYQVLIDRFADGDYSNNYNVDTENDAGYHGGDWQGLIDKLDYIAELGVTTLWISPVVKNVEEDAGFASYHGYWTQDFEATNPHFGDFTMLRKMVDAAHAKGFKVVLDIVVNHVGQAFYYDINKNGQPDDYFIGQGSQIGPIGQNDPASEFLRIQEWDPDFNIDGIQAWTSLGPSGEAPAIFVNYPAINRVPPQPYPFDQDWAYNRKGRVTVWTTPEVCGCESWGCPWDNECLRKQETLGDFPGGLKDINTKDKTVRETLIGIFSRWIDIGDFDGFRIDTLKHVEHDYFSNPENGFCPNIRKHAKEFGKDNFFMFGEAFDGNDNLLGSYTQGEGVDSVFYFSQYYTVFRGAMLGNGDRTCEIARLHCRRKGCSSDPCGGGDDFTQPVYNNVGKTNGPTSEDGQLLNSQQLVVNFIENHDVGRLAFFMGAGWSDDLRMQVIKQALAYLMFTEGIPCLYYGVEQGFTGGNDPANRETMWLDRNYTTQEFKDGHYQSVMKSYDSTGDGMNDTVWQPYDTKNPYFTWIKQLTAIRKAHLELSRGDFNTTYSTTGSSGKDHGIYAFERTYAGKTAVAVFNFDMNQVSETSDGTQSMAVTATPGTTFTDALDSSYTATVTSGGCPAKAGQGCLNVSVPSRGVRLLLY